MKGRYTFMGICKLIILFNITQNNIIKYFTVSDFVVVNVS